MPYKDLLVHLDNAPATAERVAAALALAKRQDAVVTGIALTLEPTMTNFFGDTFQLAVSEQESAQIRKSAESAIARFEVAAREAGVAFETKLVACGASSASAELTFHARHYDLVFLGQPDPRHPTGNFVDALLDGVMLGSGVPVYVVPYIGRFEMRHRKAVIAWDGSQKAARAVNAAIPLLTGRGGDAIVLIVDPDNRKGAFGPSPGAEVVTHLRRHGVSAKVDLQVTDGISVGTALLNYLSDSSADLLVMGAYGHSRIRERVFGGVSEVIIRQMTTPVLMTA